MSRTPAEAERDILRMALDIYREPNERAAMRGALGDAAALCDAIAIDIGNQNRVRGRITNKGLAMALAVSRAGDAIFMMREKIGLGNGPVPSPSPPVHERG